MSEVRPLRPGDDDYPEGLYDLEVPPYLYALGETGAAPAVAVVGTRRATGYGLGLGHSIGRALAEAGWITVSGLARGIDAAAHRGALEGGGEAVAVLGSGIDVVYPAQNRDLYWGIASGAGMVISEYPPGTPPDRWRFPARNRIIAAVSSAVVVVEAGEKGGALITARLGAELGRPVFAVPGDVDRPVSVGCNRLIRDGAHPVIGVSDLVTDLSLILGPPRSAVVVSVTTLPAGGVPVEALPELWGCTPAQAMARLARMELAGEIRRRGDTVYPG